MPRAFQWWSRKSIRIDVTFSDRVIPHIKMYLRKCWMVPFFDTHLELIKLILSFFSQMSLIVLNAAIG